MKKQHWIPFHENSFVFDQRVHIWKISIIPELKFIRQLHSLLSADERKRAERFKFDKHRHKYIAARGQLRIVLGRYLKVPPQSLTFSYNEFGKPYLFGSVGSPLIQFNMSHSHELGLIAIHKKREVGVDIEWQRPGFAGLKIARRFFSASEVEALEQLPAEQQEKAFFLCWSRKEAYIKARGRGLNIPLDQFDVSLNPEEPARLLSTKHDPPAKDQWSLQSVEADEQYGAAVVVQASGFNTCLIEARHLPEWFGSIMFP